MYKVSKTEKLWNQWLQQSIYLDAGIYNILPRVQALEQFITEGLYPFLKQFGYQWYYSEKEITTKLLHLLFMYRKGDRVAIKDFQRQEELFNQYTFLMDTSVWDSFWQRWELLEDFSEGGYAYAFRSAIGCFVWNYLDLENSSVTQTIYEEMELKQELEEQSTLNEKSKGREDPYLQDLMSESKSKYTY